MDATTFIFMGLLFGIVLFLVAADYLVGRFWR